MKIFPVFDLLRHTRISFVLVAWVGTVPLFSPAGDAWPMWRGDTQGGAVPGEPQLVNPRILPETRLWVSEADIPPGRRGSGDDGRNQDGLANMERPLSGGYGSPIAAAGMIFQYHYRPSGTVYDIERAQALGLSQEELLTLRGMSEAERTAWHEARERSLRPERPSLDNVLHGHGMGSDLDDLLGLPVDDATEEPKVIEVPPTGNLVRGHERWLVSATDVITAIDAQTGRTVWQTDMTDKGLNFGFFGKGGGGLTPAYHDGMIVSFASSAQVFGLDAQTGDIRWSYDLEPRHAEHMIYRQAALEGRSMAPRFNRGMLTALTVAEGLVIVNNQRQYRVSVSRGVKERHGVGNRYHDKNTYVALDVHTGAVRWEAPEVGSSGSNPKLVTLDGKTCVLAIHSDHLTLLDLRTGEQLWQSALGHDSPTCAFNLGVSDQYVIMAAGGEGQEGRKLSGFALSLDGLRELWTWGPIDEYRSNVLIVDEIAYMHVDEHLRAFSPATGETISEVHIGDIRPAGGNPFIAYYGGWLFTRGRGVGPESEDGIFAMRADPARMADSQQFFVLDLAQPYYTLIFPAFANGAIYFRTDHSNRIEAYRLHDVPARE